MDLSKHRAALWSDQPPIDKNIPVSYAHSKGAFFVDPQNSTGFHLTHSVPLFPKITGNSLDPVTHTDSSFGQSFVCFSIKRKAVTFAKSIYDQLVKTKVYFYKDTTGYAEDESSVRHSIHSLQERLVRALNIAKNGNLSEALKMAMGMTSAQKGGDRLLQSYQPLVLKIPDMPFTMISKHQKMKVPVFNDFLIPGLQNVYSLPSDFGLAVESWSRPNIDSVCSNSPEHRIVVNVNRVQFGLIGQKVSQDHSKWAIGIKGGEGVVCVGGMNNMTSQEKRGGSFFCLKDDHVWKSFKNIIIDSDCENLF